MKELEYWHNQNGDGITKEMLENAKQEFIERVADDGEVPTQLNIQKSIVNCDDDDAYVGWDVEFSRGDSDVMTSWDSGKTVSTLYATCNPSLVDLTLWDSEWTHLKYWDPQGLGGPNLDNYGYYSVEEYEAIQKETKQQVE